MSHVKIMIDFFEDLTIDKRLSLSPLFDKYDRPSQDFKNEDDDDWKMNKCSFVLAPPNWETQQDWPAPVPAHTVEQAPHQQKMMREMMKEDVEDDEDD